MAENDPFPGIADGTSQMAGHSAPMPRYYFNLRSYSEVDDTDGVELVGDAAARELAADSAGDLVYADIANGWLNLDHRIEVVDEAGDHVLTVAFRDAFTRSR